MTEADVEACDGVSGEAFHDVDLRRLRRDDPDPPPRTDEERARWRARTARFLTTDPEGCWVADDGGEVLGFATSLRRERVWILVTYAVRPGHQGRGIGKRVLSAAARYGDPCDRRMLSATDDPSALRRYWSAGFALHPQLAFRGEVDRSAIPAVAGLRDGTAEDIEWIDDLDRAIRGGPHGPDHTALAETGRLVVASDRGGYAYATSDHVPLLAARDVATAERLAWECLAAATGVFHVRHVTSANRWAVDVAMRARLTMGTNGHLALQGMAPPSPYIHNGALL
jgi:GNAT superfamily N-acetyltransferase